MAEIASRPPLSTNCVLDRVDLCNFKVLFGLHELRLIGTTVIMGANAAGKSNIIDGILFGLGESSTHTLRVSALKELIRKDAGRQEGVPQCYVKLYFTQNGGEILVFQRTLREDGSSIYYFNEEQVDRTRYHTEMQKCNVHVDRKHLVIMQGMIPNLTDMKKLTEQLETFSGSIKYKAQYDQLTQKHQELREKYTYTKKSGNEIRHHLKVAQQTNICNSELLNQRDNLVIEYLLVNINHHNEDLKEKQEQLDIVLERATETGNRIRDMMLNQKEKEDLLDKLSQFLVEGQNVLLENEKPFEEAKLRLIKMEEELRMKTSMLEMKQRNKDMISDQIAQINQDLQRHEAEIDAERAAIQQYESELESHLQLTDDQKLEYSTILKRFEHESASKKVELGEWKQLRNIDKEIEIKRSIQADLERNELVLSNYELRKESLTVSIAELNRNLVKCSSKLDRCEGQLDDLSTEASDVSEGLLCSRKKLNAFSELERKRLLTDEIQSVKDRMPVDCWKGRFLDLCKVKHAYLPDKPMLDEFLEQNEAAVTVTDVDAVQLCETAMKLRKTEAYKLFPLKEVRPPENLSERLINRYREGMLLIDMFNFPKHIRPSMRVVCDNHLVFRTDAEAKEASVNVNALGPSGSRYHQYGASKMHRAPDKLQMATYSPRKHDKLKQTQDRMVDKLASLFGTKQDVNQKKLKFEGEQVHIETTLALKTRELALLEELIPNTQAIIDTCNESIEQVNTMLEAKRGKFTDADEKISRLESTLRENEVSFFSEFCRRHQFGDIQVVAQSVSNDHEHLLLQIETRRSAIERLQQQRRTLEDQLAAHRSEQPTLEADIPRRMADVQEARAAMAAQKSEMEELQLCTTEGANTHLLGVQKHKEALAALAEQNQVLSEVGGERAALTRRINKLNDEMATVKQMRHQLFLDAQRRHVTLPTDGSSESTFSDLSLATLSLSDKYDMEAQIALDFDGVDAAKLRLPADEFRIYNEATQREIEQLDKDVAENAASVGKLRAIVQSYREQAAKTNADCRALMKSSQQVEGEWKAMSATRADCFNACFHRLADAVDGIYKQLHGDRLAAHASARLYACDEDHPFLSDVVFSCMQPFKGFSSMHQQSLGERSLAAIALFFALRSAIPTPLLVLDEADSALGANAVQNVAAFIKRREDMGEHSLVVTHRTEMAAGCATILSGVTKRPCKNGTCIVQFRL